MKEPLLEPTEGRLGHTIMPGDKVFTFTQASRATRICSGIYRGIIRDRSPRGVEWEYFVVERKDGKRTRLQYNGLVLAGTTLEDLDDVNI